jgi:beta-glucosidase
MELSFSAKSFSGTTTIQVGQCDENANCDATLPVELDSDWYEFSVSLSCFDDLGVDMSSISSAFVIKSETMADIGIANIGLTSDIDARASCDGR